MVINSYNGVEPPYSSKIFTRTMHSLCLTCALHVAITGILIKLLSSMTLERGGGGGSCFVIFFCTDQFFTLTFDLSCCFPILCEAQSVICVSTY